MEAVQEWLIPDEHLSAKCHFTSDSSYTTDIIFTTAGLYRQALSTSAKNMFESGIILMYENYARIVTEAKYDRILELKKFEDSLPVPFKMADAPIISIFLGWTIAVGFQALLFWVKIFFGQQNAALLAE